MGLRFAATFLLATLALALVMPQADAALVFPEAEPPPAFLTSVHRVGLTFYSNHSTNTTAPYQSTLKAYQAIYVHIIGENLTYNLTLEGDNYSLAGTTNRTHTVLRIKTGPGSVWPILTLGNQTFNFGIISVSQAPVIVEAIPQPVTMLLIEALKRELWTLIYAGAVMVSVLAAWYAFATRKKRGTVTEML